MKKTIIKAILPALLILGISDVANAFIFSGKRYHRSKVAVKSTQKTIEAKKTKRVIEKPLSEDIVSVPQVEAQEAQTENPITAPVLTEDVSASIETKPAVFHKQNRIQASSNHTISQPGKEIPSENFVKKPSRAQIREMKKELRHAAKSNDMLILEVILSILLPPVAVLIHENQINTKFWISLILTLLFFVPGIVYALLVVFNKV